MGCVDVDEEVTLDDDVIEKEVTFSYLEDVFRYGREVQEVATTRIRCGWKKFKDISSVLCKRVVSLKLRRSMNKSSSKMPYVLVPSAGFRGKKIKESRTLPK